MHPSALLIVWLSVVLAIQRAPQPWLVIGLIVAAAVAADAARQHARRLIWRTRWLLLVLALTFALLTPGESVHPGWPLTWDGLQTASEHAMRLLAVLCAVAWLMAHQSLGEIVGGLYGLVHLLGIAGARRAVLRLALVLQYAERGEVGNWRHLLASAETSAGAGGGEASVGGLNVLAPAMSRRDLALAVGAVLAAAFVWYWGS